MDLAPERDRPLRVGLVGTPELVTFPRFHESLVARGAIVVPIDPMDLVTAVDGVTDEPFMPATDLNSLDGFFAPVAGAASIVMAATLQHLEARGLPTVNGVAARSLARDKFATAEVLARAGIAQPASYLVGGSVLARPARLRIAGRLGYPLVVKGRAGSLGAQVRLATSDDDLEAIVADLDIHIDDGVILQEYFVEAGGRDFRIIVLDDEVIAVKARWSGRADEFRSAMPGYVATVGTLTAEETDLAMRATQAVGLDYSGVDLMRTSRGPMILEVNYNPFLKTTEAVTGVDIAGAVADVLLRRIRVTHGNP
jgi:ribosomal protein S6--L-glutamate ligase